MLYHDVFLCLVLRILCNCFSYFFLMHDIGLQLFNLMRYRECFVDPIVTACGFSGYTKLLFFSHQRQQMTIKIGQSLT